MADYISGNSTSKVPLYMGIAAVGLVIILGLMAFGGSGGTDAIAPTTLSEPEPITGPEAIAPTATDPTAAPATVQP